jgi:polyisoprenoid-binding protein YceI
MAVAAGTHTLGPDSGSLTVNTYREGVAAKVGHDLVIAVARWDATVDVSDDGNISSVAMNVDPRSLEVREGHRGVKPLTDKDRVDIRKNIDEKILGGRPIEFRSNGVQAGSGAVTVEGELTMGGTTRPVSAQLSLGPDGGITGTIPLVQSNWGIKPYRGLMGALKVRDDVEIVIDARLPSA